MIKTLAVVASFLSFLAYGESNIHSENVTRVNQEGVVAETELNMNSTHKQNILHDTEQINLQALIEKNNQAIELLAANQEKLISEVRDIKGETKVDYAGWASILLACVGIIITIMSVILAVVSIIGYRNFRKSIEINVKRISTEVAKSETTIQIDSVAKKELVRLIDEGALAKHLESAVDMIFLRRKPEQKESGFEKYPELDKEDGE